MSYAGISGIFIPFTEEANVNVHQNSLMLAASAAHESAHLMGIAREDEANFVAFLACLASDDPNIAYSGVMLALVHCSNKLDSISPQAYAQLYSYYREGVADDLEAHRIYWNSYKGKAEEAVSKINDNYLKSHDQEEGIMSYGRMVDLLLGYFEKLRA
jgi:hypothetical protein